MSILGILTIYMGIPTKNIIEFKKRKDYTNTLRLNIIIIKNTKGKKNFLRFLILKIIKRLYFLILLNFLVSG